MWQCATGADAGAWRGWLDETAGAAATAAASRNSENCFTLLEEIVERLARARRRRGLRLALDGGAGLEQRARVARVFRRDADGDLLLAFERRAGIEVHAL